MPAITAKRSRAIRRPVKAEDIESRSMWSLRGMEDVSFQRGSQINFWTLMGGLQMAALLTQTGILWERIQAGQWHLSLYLLDSLLIVALTWALSSWESLILRWTISIPTILSQLFGNFTLAITCLLIVNPAGWSLGLAIATGINLVHQVLLSRLGAWETIPRSMQIVRKSRLWVFGLWPSLALAGAVLMYVTTSVLVETLWGIIGLVVVLDALVRQHREMESERKELGIP